MKFRLAFACLSLIAAIPLAAQDRAVILPYPNFAELKQYLNLSDAQVQSLQSVMTARNQAQQSIYTQINQKNETLRQLLNAGTGTATQLGQLLLDINNLQKQIPQVDGPYKMQALNVLTADQKPKLGKLTEALQLQTTGYQAVTLLLIDSPYTTFPVEPNFPIGGPVTAMSATLAR